MSLAAFCQVKWSDKRTPSCAHSGPHSFRSTMAKMYNQNFLSSFMRNKDVCEKHSYVENTHLSGIIMFRVLRIRSITWAQVQQWLDWFTAAFLLKVSFTLWISWSFSLARDSRICFWLKMLLYILKFTLAVFLLTCAKTQLCMYAGRQRY